jgi:transcriptional regulator with GAF, ATPase, and Fis domain
MPFDAIRRDGLVVPVEIRLNVALEGSPCHAVASITRAVRHPYERPDVRVTRCADLPFQRLVTSLATRLSRVPAAMVDEQIGEALRLVAEALALDRAILWSKRADHTRAIASHEWTRPSFPPASRVEAPPIISRVGPTDLVIPMAPIAPIADVPAAGALQFESAAGRDWTPAVIDQLRVLSCVFGQALALKATDATLRALLAELRDPRKPVTSDRAERRPAMRTTTHQAIVAEGPANRRAIAHVEQVAPTGATVLLLGETGVGKEVFAQAIHDLSPRRARRMIRVNCAALPSTLMESELFGREAGAYTGAATRQIGRFEAADQSTLFLDEIAELSGEDQVKLLHVLQDGVVERLGSGQPVKINVRVIAATNCDLRRAVDEKRFREDLFYRINVFPIHIAPLRERPEDIPTLVWQFIDEISLSLDKRIDAISSESMRQLKSYAWPGNVRELRNVIERAVIKATGPVLTVVLPAALAAAPRAPQAGLTLCDFEFEQIRAALEGSGWRIRGRGGAAERLGLKPTTLESRIAKLGLERPKRQYAAS